MRITSNEQYQSLLNSFQNLQSRLSQDQLEITSGNKINQLSDDPAGAADIVRLTADKNEIAQYTSNAATGQDRLNYTDSVLNNVQQLVQQVITTGETALSNPTSTSMAANADQVNGLLNQLVSAANSSYQGTSLFGGTVTNAAPYAVQTDGSVTYQGNSTTTNLQIGQNTALQTGIPGDRIFSGSTNVFDAIQQLSAAISSGSQSAVQTQLSTLQQYYDSVSDVRTQVGSLINEAQNAQSSLQAYETARAADQANVQSANIAQDTTDFTQTQVSLEAAMEIGSRISQVSLLNYIQ